VRISSQTVTFKDPGTLSKRGQAGCSEDALNCVFSEGFLKVVKAFFQILS